MELHSLSSQHLHFLSITSRLASLLEQGRGGSLGAGFLTGVVSGGNRVLDHAVALVVGVAGGHECALSSRLGIWGFCTQAC